MPHIPGHNRPFTSFLTQGMQNTNQNINTMNRPNNFMPKGPGQLPMQQDFIGTGNIKPFDEQLSIVGQGFDVNNDGVVDINDATISEAFPSNAFTSSFVQDPMAGAFSFQDYQDLILEGFMGAGNNPGIDFGGSGSMFFDYLQQTNPDIAQNMIAQYYNLPEMETFGFGGSDAGWASFEIDNPVYGQTAIAHGSNQFPYYYDPEYLEESQQGFLENLAGYIQGSPGVQAQQFTGGGGQGGQAARQLYFPGTSGGFAGVGSGIDSSMLENLLNRR